MTNKQKIKIKLIGYDYRSVDNAVQEIVQTAKKSGAIIIGPVPLPTHIKKLSVNRSPHIDKKSMDQFEVRSHKRLIIIEDPNSQTVDDLRRLNLPSGVEITINL